MNKYFVGIDPGNKGFISVIDSDNLTPYFLSLADSTPQQIAHFIADHKFASFAIEDVHAIYGAAANATFKFGVNKGLLLGLLIANGCRYTLVPPKEWQKEVWTAADKAYTGKKIDTKKTSITAATRLFPNVSLLRTDKCKKPDDNKADALLIAEYARRKNL